MILKHGRYFPILLLAAESVPIYTSQVQVVIILVILILKQRLILPRND